MDTEQDGRRLVYIRFPTIPTPYIFDAGTLELSVGELVIVNTEVGQSVARVLGYASEEDAKDLTEVKPVVRQLTESDHTRLEGIRLKEKEYYELCRERIAAHGLPMKLAHVEQAFDGNKVTFYFVADSRVDFRELLKDLVERFRTRIELRQIGTRQEAAILGGIGNCGRELCCCTYLTDFQRISVKMAKNQNMTLNPTKISGLCGKLKCCLAYEKDSYAELIETMPKTGKKVFLEQGEATVVSINVISQTFIAKLEDRRFVKAKAMDILTAEDFARVSEEKQQERKAQIEAASSAHAARSSVKETEKAPAKKKRPPRKRRSKKKRSTPT